jgi:kojibiose phosphorylase
MADRRVCGLRLEVTPENHTSEIRIETGIDGDRRNLERLPLYPEGTVFPPETKWEKWARARHLQESSRSDEGDAHSTRIRSGRSITRVWRCHTGLGYADGAASSNRGRI